MSAEIPTTNSAVQIQPPPSAISKIEAIQNVSILSGPNIQQLTNSIKNVKLIDGPDLVPLLQSIGFVLQGMDKHDNLQELHKLLKNKEENAIKIEITCVKSGTKATLVKDDCACKCPSEDAQFWNISGCGPSLQGNISVTKSNLVPTISWAKSKTINTMLLKCMEFIVSANASDTVDVVDEFKQASSMAKQKSAESLKQDPNLSRITLGSSPPRHSSSPIADSFKSLKHSRSSMDGNEKLLDVLKKIDKLVKQAMELSAGTNLTFTKTPRLSDVLKISPLATESNTSQQSVNAEIEVKETVSTPAMNTPKKVSVSTGAKKKGLVPPSRLNLLKYKRDVATPSLGRVPSTSMVKDRPGKSFNLSAAKVKTAISTDTALQSKLKPRTPIFGSKIAMKK